MKSQTDGSMKKEYSQFTDITGISDALDYFGLTEKAIPQFEELPDHLREPMKAITGIVIGTEACNHLANGGKSWVPDYEDNTWKFEAWWKWDAKKGGFRLFSIDGWSTGTIVGPRLSFLNEKVGKHVVEVFSSEYLIWNKP